MAILLNSTDWKNCISPAHRVILFSIIISLICLEQVHAQVRLSSEEADKLVIEKPEPVYPAIAKAARAEGIVKVETIVSEQGAVRSAKAISGHPLLREVAIDAVKKRRYKAHMVDGKPVPFSMDVYISFPPGNLTNAQKQDNEKQDELARQYFKEDDNCRNLVRAQKWSEAEEACKVIVRIADQFSDRSLEKMGAYELFGYVLRGQKRYKEALEYFNRALDAVRSSLTEKNAELGQLYGDMAITHHLMGDLDIARELYRKAERIYQIAHADMGGGDPHEEIEKLRQNYMKSLKRLLEYHLIAAQDAGATSEVEEIRKLIKSLP